MGNFLIVVGVLVLVSLALLVWPVQWAARLMGAGRTSAFWCILSLVAAAMLQLVAGAALPSAGPLVAFLLEALVFAALLETTYLRGVGIALLHTVFFFLIVLLFVALGIAMPLWTVFSL